MILVPVAKLMGPVPRALLLLMFKVPAVRVTPPAAPELFPLKVNVPPAAFIVVRPPYVLPPDNRLVPVLVNVTLPPVLPPPPLAIVPFTVALPAPAKVKVLVAELSERSIPPLKTIDDPLATDDQVAFPELINLLPKVWATEELFVMAPLLRTLMSVPVHV